MKKRFTLFLCLCLSFSLFSCQALPPSPSSDRELCAAGLDLIAVLSEMINSEEYAQLFINNTASLNELKESVNTRDYDSPKAVYRIGVPETEELLQLTGTFSKEAWNKLSPALQKQLKKRVSFSTLIGFINGKKGSTEAAFSSVFHAFETNDKLKVQETTLFLYVFEKGTPVVVSFSPEGGLNAQFLFLENTNSLSELRSTFDKYRCPVSPIELN